MDYTEVISLRKLKEVIKAKGYRAGYIAEQCGITNVLLSNYMTDFATPMTGMVAKLAFVLKVPVSEIVEFKGIEQTRGQSKWFSEHTRQYKPPADAVGELTYAPLWELIDGFLADVNSKLESGVPKKTAKDIFDGIEPPRKKIGANDIGVEKAHQAKGYGDKDELKTRKRKTEGLSELNRTKLRNDRPMSLRTIYEICRKLGCSVDWVMSYK